MKVLADGTYLAELAPPRKSDGPPLTVRVIEYTVHTTPENGGDEQTSELFCLVADLLNPEEYPALDLARRYPRRWNARPSSAATRPTWTGSRCCAARTRPASNSLSPLPAYANHHRSSRAPHISSHPPPHHSPSPSSHLRHFSIPTPAGNQAQHRGPG